MNFVQNHTNKFKGNASERERAFFKAAFNPKEINLADPLSYTHTQGV